MGRQSGFQNAFNIGELSPDAWSRSDLVQHSKGCALGYNMIGRVAGPTGRRPGTWFVGLPKFSATAGRLVPFRRSSADALVLEFGHLYVRVWTVNGAPVMDGPSQVEFTTVYTAAQLDGLRWRQSGDVLYLTHRDNLSPRVIRRLSNTSWQFDGLGFSNGPYRGENGDATRTLNLSGTTLTASFSAFVSGHVGSLWRLRSNAGNPGVLSWEPGEESVTMGAQRLSDGRVYGAASGGTAGNTPPVHDSGTVSDGGVEWTHLHDGAAVVVVTAFTSATEVTVALLTGAPAGLDAGTPYWSEGAYSDVRGWPTANPAVREERLALAGAFAEPDGINLTRTAGFGPATVDFTPGLGTGRVVDDDAVKRFVGGDRDRIVWMEGSSFLLAGTTDGEFIISGGTLDDPISPSGCVARPVGEFGSADVMPALAYGGVVFVAAGGETLRLVAVAPDQSLELRDLNVVAGHIGARGLAEMTWMKQPLNLFWFRLSDGGQASFTYHREQAVEGWNRHGIGAPAVPTEEEPLGGGMVLESSCVVPGFKGRPRLFMLVSRIKDDVPQRLILRLAEPADKLFLDAAERYAGAATAGVGGLNHLAGEPVTLMAATEAGASAAVGKGWGEYRDRMVDEDGEALLPDDTTATAIYGGLPFLSRWEGLTPDFGGPGATAGRLVRYTHVSVVLEAAVAYTGTVGDEGDSGRDRLLNRAPGDVGGPVVRRTAWKSAALGGASRDRRYFVETDHGWDLVIHSIRATADVE
ncbi:hypothetical protein [Brevundimonas sp.]|uniref:hypothetical protein n=1 Tax=Brevundimonas sp. TaxID=1871086 RepID=UPI00286C188B|nr:hypothetical protein [Brevundimonas sp.]